MKEMSNINTKENLMKSFTMADNMMNIFWDMWQLSMGNLSWNQDQLETMTKNYLKQSKLASQESNKVMEDLMKQVKKNQLQMQEMMNQAVRETFEDVVIPFYNYGNEIIDKNENLSVENYHPVG
jgi:polyhydroxyalkanoate synthesis regulator phasin